MFYPGIVAFEYWLIIESEQRQKLRRYIIVFYLTTRLSLRGKRKCTKEKAC